MLLHVMSVDFRKTSVADDAVPGGGQRGGGRGGLGKRT